MTTALLYARIALHVAGHYLIRPAFFSRFPSSIFRFPSSIFRLPFFSIRAYFRFLARALRLLLVFRHNRPVRTPRGWKLHLYLPAYPSRAFFRAIEAKLLRTPPGPVTVVFSMTKACTFKCRHCYQRHDRGQDVPEARLLEIAAAVRDAGTSMFDIEGGEPLLRPDRLLRLCASLGDGVETWVNSTGDALQPDTPDALRRAGVYGVMVSLHAPDADAHDALTGVPGSFETACAMLRRCRATGLVTAANTVLSEEDLRRGRLDDLMTLTRTLGCDFVQLIHPKPAGLWLGRTEGMQTDPDLLAAIRQAHRTYNDARHRDYPALAAQAFEESPEVLGCTAGAIDRFYVNAHGEVQPCEFLNISFGNAAEEPFAAIFARMRAAFPTPGVDWLCCTRAHAIDQAIRAAGGDTPLRRPATDALTRTWVTERPTPIYRKLGIYR